MMLEDCPHYEVIKRSFKATNHCTFTIPQPTQLRVQQSIAGMYGQRLFTDILVSLFQSPTTIKNRPEENGGRIGGEVVFLRVSVGMSVLLAGEYY